MHRHFYYILRIAVALAGIATFFGAWNRLASGEYLLGLFLSFLFALCGGLFAATDHLYTDNKTRWSDDLTPNELEFIITKHRHNYCLLLRPFNADSNVKLINTLNPFLRIGIGFGMPIIDVQEWMIRCSSPDWRFFSWGGDVGGIRPSRVVAKDNWFDDLKKIARLVDVIVMIAGYSESIKTELDFLLKEVVHHCIILFPPRSQNEQRYREIRESARLRPLLPGVPDEGCLFLPYRGLDGSVEFASYPLTRRSLRLVLEARRKATAT